MTLLAAGEVMTANDAVRGYLRTLRVESTDYTQKQIAEMVDRPRGYVQWERAATQSLDVVAVLRAVQALNGSVSDLMLLVATDTVTEQDGERLARERIRRGP